MKHQQAGTGRHDPQEDVQRYVVLGNEKGPGEILGIYDERGSVLCRNL